MRTTKRKLGVLILHAATLTSALSSGAYAQDTIKALEDEKKRIELEAAIEKYKADIAESKRKQREAEVLLELGIRQKEAEARKLEAEAEKGEALAKIPPTEIKALPGSIDIKNFGAAGLAVAVDLARDLASYLCKEIPSGKKIAIFDATTASGVVSARLLDAQLDLFKNSLSEALEKSDPDVYKTFSLAPGFDAAIATGTIKAFADLASLFKTNVSVTKTDFAEAKSAFATAMASACPTSIASLGTGYLGEMDQAPIDDLRKKALQILGDKAKLDDRIEQLKKRIEDEKDATKKKPLQTQLAELIAVVKQVDGFLAIIKPSDVNDKSLLPTAAKYLAQSKRIADANVLDFDIRLEGLSIVKENIFTGQKLRLSATAILWYRVHEINGALVKAGVVRQMAKPIQVDLRGDDPKDEFWSK